MSHIALDEKLSLRGVSGIWNKNSHHFLTGDYSSGPPFQSSISYCDAVMMANTQWRVFAALHVPEGV